MRHVLALTLLACLPVCAADQVVLTNGDTITGTIVKKDGARLTIKSELLGAVTMPWSAVQSIRSDSDVFVQFANGEIVQGKLATADESCRYRGPRATKTAPLRDVKAVRDAGGQHTYERMLHPSLLELWTGNFDIGLALARGNSRTDTFTTAFNAARNTHADKIVLSFNQIYGTARANNTNSTIASAVRGGIRYNRNVTPRFFLSVINDYEHDRFQNLDLRFVAGPGAGIRAVKREHLSLDLDFGGNYSRENFLDGVHRNSAEWSVGDTVLFKVSGATTLTQAFQMFNNVSTKGAYRINFDLGAVTAVRSWLGWHLNASDRYLSNPVQGRLRNDVLLSTGFRLTFAH